MAWVYRMGGYITVPLLAFESMVDVSKAIHEVVKVKNLNPSVGFNSMPSMKLPVKSAEQKN